MPTLKRFWQWLFSEFYAPTARCGYCGERHRHKSRMFHDPVDGWFCNESEYDQYWWRLQK